MRLQPHHIRRGMTLAELLVVIAIIGLLAVTAAPLLVGNRLKKAIRDGADAAESAFSHVATKAMTSPTGAAVWLETGTTGAGINAAVTTIASARVPLAANGSTVITANNATTVTVSLGLAAAFANDLPAPIEFAGVPGVFTAIDSTTVTSGTSAVSGPVNRTLWNSAPPLPTSTPVGFVVRLPPRPSSFAGATPLPPSVAIDLSASQIGVVSPVILKGYQRLAIEYDRTGAPVAAWLWAGSWSRQLLTPSTPILLAIGERARAGENWVLDPTEDNPGASWQSPYARWLLVDPRNGAARVIEAGSCRGATNEAAARALSLAPVLEEFRNSRS